MDATLEADLASGLDALGIERAHGAALLDYLALLDRWNVGSSRVDLQACKLEYSIVSPK